MKCMPAQRMSADKLYKWFRSSSGTKKIGPDLDPTVHHQHFQTSTPETTVSNELPISFGDSFADQMGLLKTVLLVT